ncbi:MAG: response regulator [Acidimicrobiia bacterium]
MTETIGVLVVDDEALVRAGFVMILDSEPGISVLGEAENGQQAIAVAKELDPDVILMDIRMPVLDGIAATREICKPEDSSDMHPRVLMLTTFNLDDYVYDALRAGASGFLLKDTPPDGLVHAVRVVAAGDALLAPSVTRQLIDEFGRSSTATKLHPGIDDLTERETEVLRQMARGLSNAETADELFVSEATVKTHVSHILTKLDLRDRVQAVVAAYESGLVQPGDG